MAAPLRPAMTKAYLREKWIFVPTLANQASPTVAELTGASSLDVTKMFLMSSARPSQTTNMVRQPKTIGDAETYEFVGEKTLTLGEVRYSFNPQGAALSDGKKAYEKFGGATGAVTGYLVRRLGINRDTDIAAAQFVTVWPVETGEPDETPEGDGEAAVVAIAQPFAITGPKSLNVAVAA